MPTGTVTISFYANTASNTVNYTISGAGIDPVVIGSENVICTAPGPCFITVPVTYDNVTCSNILVEGEVYCDAEDPVLFTQEILLPNLCQVYNIKCTKKDANGNPMDCRSFGTGQTCPDCLATDPDSILVTTYNTGLYPDGSPNLLQALPADRVPYDTEFRFCYLPNQTTTRPLNGYEITPLEQNEENCCTECELREFIITPAFYNGSLPPVSSETYVVNLIYTSCAEGCYLPANQLFLPKLVADEPYVFTACMVKDSWTIMATVPNIPVYTTSIISNSCNP